MVTVGNKPYGSGNDPERSESPAAAPKMVASVVRPARHEVTSLARNSSEE